MKVQVDVPKCLMIGGVVGLAITLIGGFFAMPRMIESAIRGQKGLKEGTEIRELWQKFPFPLAFDVYMFNVTNPLEVQQGGVPNLQEVGPFCYDEYKWKTIGEDRNIDDTVTFRPEGWWYFNKERSGGLTGDEMVTIPNALLLGVVTMVEREAPATMSIVNKAMNEIFHAPDSIYLTVPVRDILFDGILINCTVKEFAAKAVCAKLEEKVGTAVKKVGDHLYKFSLFGMKNGTAGEVFRVNRGIKKAADVGKVVEYNNNDKLSVWRGEGACNNISGTDGTIFKPFLVEGERLEAFAPDICKAFNLDYVRKDVYKGVPVFRYKGGFGDIASDPEQACYCTSETTCPKKGSIDLTQCQGTPVIVTLPHFYDSVPEYLEGVTGLSPNQEKHEIVLNFEPVTGTPLYAASRMQLNMEMHAVAKIDTMKNLKTTMHPLLWVDEGIVVPQKFVDVIKNDLLRSVFIAGILKWVILAGSILMIAVGYWLHTRTKANSADITDIGLQPGELPKQIDVVKDSSPIRY